MSIKPGFIRTKLGGWRTKPDASCTHASLDTAGLVKVDGNYYYPTEEWSELDDQQQYACECEAAALNAQDHVLIGPSAAALHGYWVRTDPKPHVRTVPATTMAPHDYEDFHGALVETAAGGDHDHRIRWFCAWFYGCRMRRC